MFTYLRLKNFKSFTNIELDMRGRRKVPKKLVSIYGENGAGKSNIVLAFYTLVEILRTMAITDKINEFLKELDSVDIVNKEEDKLFAEFVRDRYRDLKTIIKQSKSIGSQDNMLLEFGFRIYGKEGYYLIETDDEKVVREELYCIIEKNAGFYFKINDDNIYLNSKIFKDNNYKNEIEEKINKFWGKHTLLGILVNEMITTRKGYLNKKTDANLMRVLNFLDDFSVSVKIGNKFEKSSSAVKDVIWTQLQKGEINITDKYKLEAVENFLNEFFTNLYSDIKGVYYAKENEGEEIKYKLHLKKLVGQNIIDIDFAQESTGTQRILDLIPNIYNAINGGVVFIDEFDTGIHDKMVGYILNAINKCLKGQLIITTHNTLIMEEVLEKDSIYVINIDSEGNKKILCINDYDKRTHPNHNIRSSYLRGMYEGIPYFGEIDFLEIVHELKENLKE